MSNESETIACPRCHGSGEVEVTQATILGMNVRRLREAAGMRQEDLAERVGRNRTSVVNIEGGKHNPSMDFLVGLRDALGCSFDDLLSVPQGETT